MGDLNVRGYYKNPRKISPEAVEKLRENLELLGDLSGIVHNEGTNELIGGNQRGKIFDINECRVEITETLPEPDKQGTTARGFVYWKDHKYTYRRVRWSSAQCERANITANSLGGTWDEAILLAKWKDFDGINDWELPILFEAPTFIDNEIEGGTHTNNKYHDVKAMVFLSVNLLQREIPIPETEAKLFLDEFESLRLRGDEKVMAFFLELYQSARKILRMEPTVVENDFPEITEYHDPNEDLLNEGEEMLDGETLEEFEIRMAGRLEDSDAPAVETKKKKDKRKPA